MEREIIEPSNLNVNPHKLFAEDWLLLCAGDFESGKFNFMTIGWGMLGTAWGKPCAMAMVRPQRHTFKFMEESEDFTICAFPKSCRRALEICGSKSGRDCDKAKEAGLTPEKSEKAKSPGFAEAELLLECRKIYFDDMNPGGALDSHILDAIYPQRDFHRFYIGEIIFAKGARSFSKG